MPINTSDTAETYDHEPEGRSTSRAYRSSVDRRTRAAAEQTIPNENAETQGYGAMGQSSPLISKVSVDIPPPVLAELPLNSAHTQSTSSLRTHTGPLEVPVVIPPSASLGKVEKIHHLTPHNSADSDSKDIENTPPHIDVHNAWGSPSSTKTTPVKTPKSTSSSNQSSPEKEYKW